jgi:hypothetical protein
MAQASGVWSTLGGLFVQNGSSSTILYHGKSVSTSTFGEKGITEPTGSCLILREELQRALPRREVPETGIL